MTKVKSYNDLMKSAIILEFMNMRKICRLPYQQPR
jgi:hypothetical protein